ncbi:MAG: DUF2235 domain-containing protein, partial [Burkholderiales bacterium]
MPKDIIVCADGTWNRPSEKDRGKPAPTNVFKIFKALGRTSERTLQSAAKALFYDAGVGTNFGTRILGGLFGVGLSENIRDCYEFIVKNYQPCDRLFLFGFSRGAYTARSLGGFIMACGVLRNDLNWADEERRQKIGEAYALYRDGDAAAKKSFKQAHSLDSDIEMIGVWDTVGALGIPLIFFRGFNRWIERFHDTALHPQVKHGYHAVALDEERAEFMPTLWDDRAGIEQVWFCGVHSNVGGGYADSGLSDLTLNWMITKAKILGLQFDQNALAGLQLKPNPCGE